MTTFFACFRVVLVTQILCVITYASAIGCFARWVVPTSAEGSLLRRADGSLAGSRLIAQSFTRPEYFWPRPSAVDYHAAGAGGSNLASSSQVLAARAASIVALHGAGSGRLLPADLVAASGSGLDPHLTEAAARFQLSRVAAARGLDPLLMERLLAERLFFPGGFRAGSRLVNVLELNLALDELR